ncbi:hypothetical protein [Colwellia sp. E150_009]
MANENIGHVLCPLSDKLSVVRADKRGKLYYFSECGKIAPNLPQGQKWLNQKTVFWDDGQPENIRIETLYNGAPPVVTLTQESEPLRAEKPLTPEPEPRRVEKPLTPEPVTKKRPFLSEFFNDWGGDDE